MRDYGKVGPKFWIGSTGKALRKRGAAVQLVALYLLTCPNSNMLGMYYLPKTNIAHECGLTLEGASKALQSCIEAGFCAYDEDAEVVWVYEMARFQIADQLDPKDRRCKGVENDYLSQMQSVHLPGFFDKYAEAFHLTVKREGSCPSEAPSKPLASQEQEQEQEQDKKNRAKKTEKTRSKAVALSLFQRFYAAYPRKKHPGDAEKAFIATKADEALLAKMLAAIDAARSSGDWSDPKFIPYPATWLRARGWEDQQATVAPDGTVKPWWQSKALIQAKAAELSLPEWDESKEPWPTYRDRVYVAAGDGPWMEHCEAAKRAKGEGGFRPVQRLTDVLKQQRQAA